MDILCDQLIEQR